MHQFIATLNPHDATGTHALRLRDALAHGRVALGDLRRGDPRRPGAEAFKHWMYPEHAAPGDVAIYQFTTSSAVAGYLAEHGLPLILDFHNFTGPEYFAGWEPQSVQRAAAAADELALLAPRALLGLAKSPFSEEELRRAGCRRTAVVPVLADYGRVAAPPDPRVAAELARLGADGGADILFVGRIVPSKAQHELVKALWAYRRLYDGKARLHLVGGTSSFEYTKALQGFVHDLGLSAAVRLPGEVSDAALAAYFGAADVYLSLSAHEGFGVPLVEAMVAGVPVVTRGAGAVSDTVADAALVLAAADPSYIAAAVHRVCTDEQLRATLTAAGRPPGGRALRGRGRRPHPRCRRRCRGGGREPEGGLRHASLRPADHGRRRDGGAPAGRAPARPDRLGGRGPHDLRARRHHLGRRAGTGDHGDQRRDRAPAPVGARPAARLLRPRRDRPPRPAPGDAGSRESGGSTTTVPVSPELVDAVVASDADVVAFSPVPLPPDGGDHRQGARAGGVPPGGARRAGPLPAGVPRHLRGRRRLLLLHGLGAHARRADVPRGGAPADRARPRRGRVRGGRTARPRDPRARGSPYIVSVGRVDEHKGSKMLASYFATYKERHPGPLALALVGPVSVELPPAPRHRGDGRGERARQVGHHARRRSWRSRRPRSSRSHWW